ncbi:MAG: SCO family protein [Steroidobacteraceae bacterium]
MAAKRPVLPFVLIAVLAAIVGAGVALSLRDDAALATPPPPALAAGTYLPAARSLQDFNLLDPDGKPVTLADLRGRPSLLFFGFTQCPDVCPTTLALLSTALQRATAPDLRVVLVSVDPERDTPQRLGAYVRAFDPSFTGLTGSLEEIEKLARQLGVAAVRVPRPGGDYTIDHSAALLWLDRDARLTTIFTPPFAVEALAGDFTTLAAL